MFEAPSIDAHFQPARAVAAVGPHTRYDGEIEETEIGRIAAGPMAQRSFIVGVGCHYDEQFTTVVFDDGLMPYALDEGQVNEMQQRRLLLDAAQVGVKFAMVLRDLVAMLDIAGVEVAFKFGEGRGTLSMLLAPNEDVASRAFYIPDVISVSLRRFSRGVNNLYVGVPPLVKLIEHNNPPRLTSVITEAVARGVISETRLNPKLKAEAEAYRRITHRANSDVICQLDRVYYRRDTSANCM